MLYVLNEIYFSIFLFIPNGIMLHEGYCVFRYQFLAVTEMGRNFCIHILVEVFI